MNLLALPVGVLSWIERQGTYAVAGALVAGIAVPPLAAWLKPLFTPSLFALLCLAFLRVDPTALRSHFARPWLLLAVVAWIMLATPILFGVALPLMGLQQHGAALFLALMLQTVAPPLLSASTLAALMGLDAALSLATLIACTVMAPLTAPLLTALFVGGDISVTPTSLGLRLLAMLAGAAVIATAIRYVAGREAVARQRHLIDGISVVMLFVFAAALMDDVLAQTVADPLRILGLTVLTFAMTGILIFMTTAVFWPLGQRAAVTLGLAAGSRNMGLMLAAVGASAPELAWLYIAIAQAPIYLLPLGVKPLVQHFIHRPSD